MAAVMAEMSRRTLLAAAPAAAVAAAVPEAIEGAVDRGGRNLAIDVTSPEYIRRQFEKYRRLARGEPSEDGDGVIIDRGGYTISPEVAALKSISPVAAERIQRERENARILRDSMSYGQRVVDSLLKKHPFLRMLT